MPAKLTIKWPSSDMILFNDEWFDVSKDIPEDNEWIYVLTSRKGNGIICINRQCTLQG